ncbi:MAG: HAD family hydrolase [Actinobacteria bacterium]|nr:HAD family hydrolase [Actinomycetota bacterium]MCB9389921.1 HAD family hydrolase [Acidimicrobiia bacterium]
MPIEAVTFDFWNTICVEAELKPSMRQRRFDRMTDLISSSGIDVDPAHVWAALEAGHHFWNDAWERNEHLSGSDGGRHVLARLQASVPEVAPIADALVASFAPPDEFIDIPLAPGVAEAIARLAERGIGLGIICDVGYTSSAVLKRSLDAVGLLDAFDVTVFSDDYGVYKPDPLLFEQARTGLGRPDPTAMAHIGDRRRTDMAGAQQAGFRAIRYAGAFDDVDAAAGPSGDAVILHFDALLSSLPLSQ